LSTSYRRHGKSQCDSALDWEEEDRKRREVEEEIRRHKEAEVRKRRKDLAKRQKAEQARVDELVRNAKSWQQAGLSASTSPQFTIS